MFHPLDVRCAIDWPKAIVRVVFPTLESVSGFELLFLGDQFDGGVSVIVGGLYPNVLVVAPSKILGRP